MENVKLFKVSVQTHESSVPRVFEAEATYTKGPLFCIKLGSGLYKKIPLTNIFDISEDYR